MAHFVSATWKLSADLIVPVPPSNTARRNQPVMDVAVSLSRRGGIALWDSCITNVKSTSQLKDVFELARRPELLKDTFAVDRSKTAGKRILLPAGLYRSGATAGTISRLLAAEGGARAVYLTLTRVGRADLYDRCFCRRIQSHHPAELDHPREAR
ncbi:MAG: hypothetical protein JJE04_25940 [Acidobacteriia bacterium]|nr:hypothetical protein [Terriglobia bacterium]